MDISISGTVTEGFEPVKEVFTQLWEEIEIGASLCVYHRGRKVVDLWGGFRDPAMTQPWRADTLINVYSTTKGMGSLALAILHDEGKIDYN